MAKPNNDEAPSLGNSTPKIVDILQARNSLVYFVAKRYGIYKLTVVKEQIK
ncbi:MAG: hypothetical protein ACTS8H_04235 [Arsenophonus sp. NC-PE1-MAG3]